MLVENPDTQDIEYETEPEEIMVVQPTLQWQTLKPGQREVRQGEEQVKYWTNENRRNRSPQDKPLSAKELKHALKKMKEEAQSESNILKEQDKDSIKAQFRPLEELKKDLAKLDLMIETDTQVMTRLFTVLNSSISTMEQKVKAMLELEYLVHQVDNAQDLVSMGGMKLVLKALNSSEHKLQETAAFVLGSALASNPMVQVEAMESGALQRLLTLLASTQPMSVKKKVLFAMASLLRHFPYAQSHFVQHGGVQILGELFRATDGGILRIRIVTLLYDMIIEKELISQAGLDSIPDSSHQERLLQYSQVSLQPQLIEGGWCSLVSELLESPEHDWREKALRALLAMMPLCQAQYRQDGLAASFSVLRHQYHELAQSEQDLGEDNGYFGEILDLLDTLIQKLK
ncbi:nucleotide exchange factor SIL1 [Aplochiton taeniatus]